MHLNYDCFKHFTGARRALLVQHCWAVWNIRCKSKLNCWLLLFWPLVQCAKVPVLVHWDTETTGEMWKKLEQGEGNAQNEKGQWSVGGEDKRNYCLRNDDHRKEKWRWKVGGCVESALGKMKRFCVHLFHWNKILQSPANTMATALRQVMPACSWGSADTFLSLKLWENFLGSANNWDQFNHLSQIDSVLKDLCFHRDYLDIWCARWVTNLP